MLLKAKSYCSENFPNILVFGYVFLLSGMFLVSSRGSYKTIVYITLILPVVIYIASNLGRVWREFFSKRIVWSFFLILLYFAFTSVWGGEKSLLTSIRRVLLYAIAAYGLFHLYSNHRQRFYKGSLVGLVVMSLLSLFWLVDFYYLNSHSNYLAKQLFNGVEDHFGLYGGEGYAAFFNPLLFSHVMVFAIALSFVTYFDGRQYLNEKMRLLVIFSSLIFLAALIAAQTRMAWIVVAVLMGYELIRLLRLYGVWLSVLGLLAAVVLIVLFGDELIARGDSHRLTIWQHVAQLILDKPIFGAGFGAQLSFTPDGSTYTWYDTHNFPLAVLYYTGIAGAGSLLLWLCYLLKQAAFCEGGPHFFGVWLIVFVLGGLTDGGGLMSRPSEHWFNIWLPLFFLLTFVVSHRVSELKVEANSAET